MKVNFHKETKVYIVVIKLAESKSLKIYLRDLQKFDQMID
jgi:hypothetical protein